MFHTEKLTSTCKFCEKQFEIEDFEVDTIEDLIEFLDEELSCMNE